MGRLVHAAWPVVLAFVLLLAGTAANGPGLAQDASKEMVPDTWRGDVRRPRPDLTQIERLRFVTDADYPPFDYYDEEGALTGFNVDLARAICNELAVECEISRVSWNQLVPGVVRGEADAAIASIRATPQTLEKLDFTESYYRTPARFAVRKGTELKTVSPDALDGKTVAVAKNTAHAAFLEQFFPKAKRVPVDTPADAFAALKDGKADLAFADGIALLFWLNGTTSGKCCAFLGGPYTEPAYFGDGVGIAVKKGNRDLRAILNYGLEQVRASGRYEELFLRYFPTNFF